MQVEGKKNKVSKSILPPRLKLEKMVYIRCKLTEVRDIDLYRVSEACDIDPLVKVIPQGQGHHRSGQIV